MNQKTIIFIILLSISCNSRQTRNEQTHSEATIDSNSKIITEQTELPKKEVANSYDTISSQHLIYLLQNEKPLNNYWTQKLHDLDIFTLPLDTMCHLSLIRDWITSDSISVIILSYSTGTSYDEFLLTIGDRGNVISKVHISDSDDSDLSPGNPYYYTEYKILDDRKIKLFNHKVTGNEGASDKDRLLSTETFVIQNNGKVLKK